MFHTCPSVDDNMIIWSCHWKPVQKLKFCGKSKRQGQWPTWQKKWQHVTKSSSSPICWPICWSSIIINVITNNMIILDCDKMLIFAHSCAQQCYRHAQSTKEQSQNPPSMLFLVFFSRKLICHWFIGSKQNTHYANDIAAQVKKQTTVRKKWEIKGLSNYKKFMKTKKKTVELNMIHANVVFFLPFHNWSLHHLLHCLSSPIPATVIPTVIVAAIICHGNAPHIIKQVFVLFLVWDIIIIWYMSMVNVLNLLNEDTIPEMTF